MRYSNQHLHALPASPDGMAQLPEMIEACAAAGLRIATFTDHMDMADEPTGRTKNTYPLRRRFFEERRALDIYYVRNWSLMLDLAIFFKTIAVVLKGEGAK